MDMVGSVGSEPTFMKDVPLTPMVTIPGGYIIVPIMGGGHEPIIPGCII